MVKEINTENKSKNKTKSGKNKNILDSMSITPVKLFYSIEGDFDFQTESGDIIRRTLETLFKKIDDNQKSGNNQYFFRNKFTDAEIQERPELKGLNPPPTGYALNFDIAGENLIITINLFGYFKNIIPFLQKDADKLLKKDFGKNLCFERAEDALGGVLFDQKFIRQLPATTFDLAYFQGVKPIGSQMLVHFLSPVNLGDDLNQKGSIIYNDFYRSLYSRAVNINALYCGGGFLSGENKIPDENSKVNIPYSKLNWCFRQTAKGNMVIKGYTGTIKYAFSDELLQKHLPLLLLGQWLQIGDKTNYGAGYYEIDHGSYQFT